MIEENEESKQRIHGWGPQQKGDLLILDNRDSFVFNLAHRFFEVGHRASVVRSDAVSVADIARWEPSRLVISPGPDHPDEAGVSIAAIRHFAGDIPILGVCLGHQAIAAAFGGTVEPGGRPVHGMASAVEHDGAGVFDGIPAQFSAARYHSLVVTDWPEELVATAWADGFVMGLRHRRLPIYGVQFHPESVLTPMGRRMLKNFCELEG